MIMKKFWLVLAGICLVASGAYSKDNLRERVYLSTDKGIYVAGDALWCSAYSVDVNTGRLSTFSNIAYVEVHSADGMACTGKIALENGRGAGRVNLPNTLPTGNYRVLAYTAQSCNEVGYDYLMASKTISVFNPLTNERVKDGVRLVSETDYAQKLFHYPGQEGRMSLVAGETYDGRHAFVKVSNNGVEPLTLNVSVYHNDGIISPRNGGIADFISELSSLPAAKGFTRTRVPEYEGEIIRAKVSGTDAEGIRAVASKHVFFSTPSAKPDSYSSSIDSEGNVSIYTSNIYGDKEMFVEIENPGKDNVCHLEIIPPFVDAAPGEIPALEMCPSLGPKLESRSMSMQIGRAFESDTLYEFLPISAPDLFSDGLERYNLDDYTRFPLLEETIIEFITELRVRKFEGRRDIQVLMRDSYRDAYFSQGVSLAMIDGIPVFDQEKVLSYDPALIHYVDIYPYTYFIGSRCFSGVVNFVTYKGNLPTLEFEDNVRIVNFQGASYPQAVTGEGLSDAYPDYRRTILWQPLVTVAPGESITLECKTPAYGGRFEVVAEGVGESTCSPVYSHTFMELGPR